MWIVAICLLLQHTYSGGNGLEMKTSAVKLLGNITSTYTKCVRPLNNQTESVIVELLVEMKHILDVEITSQQVQFLLTMKQKWRDDFLIWNPDDYNGIKEIMIDPNAIWLPDLIIVNSVEDFEQIEEVTIFKAKVKHTGEVEWHRPLITSIYCEMNVRTFPWDKQECPLLVSSLRHSISELNISLSPAPEGDYDEHHEWKLTNQKQVVQINTKENYIHAEFNYTFQRQPKFYINNVIAPTALLSVLAMLAFLLPNNCGEKIGFSIMVFLTLTVNLVIITNFIPVSSETFPYIGEYYLACIILTALSLTQSTLILSLHFTHDEPGHVPKILYIVFLQRIGPFLGTTKKFKKIEYWNCMEEEVLKLSDEGTNIIQTRQMENIEVQTLLNAMKQPLDGIYDAVRFMALHRISSKNSKKTIEEWQCLALVIDRISAILFITLTLIISFYFIGLAYSSNF